MLDANRGIAPGPGNHDDIASFMSVRVKERYISNSLEALGDILPEITICKLSWCAQTYASSRFENGELHDVPTSSVPLFMNGSNCSPNANNYYYYFGYPANEPPPTFSDGENGQPDGCHLDPQPNGTYLFNAANQPKLSDECRSVDVPSPSTYAQPSYH